MARPALDERLARRQRIIAGMQGRELEQVVHDPSLWDDFRAEADSPDPDRLVTPDLLGMLERTRAQVRSGPRIGLFFSTDDVLLVPGFMGSELTDQGLHGLIWITPRLVVDAGPLMDLRLDEYRPDRADRDATPGVDVRPGGAVPLIYGALKLDLELRRYDVRVFAFDWRKDLEESSEALAAVVRERSARQYRPLHLVAHSQGSLVARRALQKLGPELSRRLVSNLVLLGPATAGTFSAALAIAGTHESIEAVRRFGVKAPPGFARVLQSWSGLYQFLPWRRDPVDAAPGAGKVDPALRWVREHAADLRKPAFWTSGVDPARLDALLGRWGAAIDTGFLNDRTTIILGDRKTVGGVRTEGGRLVPDPAYATQGDGTVPDSFARISGVTRVYRCLGAEHMMLPATPAVIAAVRDVLAGRAPRTRSADAVLRAAPGAADVPCLDGPGESGPTPLPSPTAVIAQRALEGPARAGVEQRAVPVVGPPVPVRRRLRVYSFDPLLATQLDALGTETIALELPWSFTDGDALGPGPVGEYLEVVDHDPASDVFYPPVDLNHPHLLAQDGMPPSEGDPRFHQQMVYAVAMTTIQCFERALGRVALWAPRLKNVTRGEVVAGLTVDDEYVGRLRIYPHALRQENAYYDPVRKALLFGYFSADRADVGRNLPGGTIFTCLSYDVIAHETTHALLDGLHRYFTEPSNDDVHAFHEAFADVVALFQHFSHPEVLHDQLARSQGDLRRESLLGVLAAQFGEAIGERGALRRYIGRRDEQGHWHALEPDPRALVDEHRPHERGAVLVAALFRAFLAIYDRRVRDLRRIASGGTGKLPDGDLHPDLVGRLASEAARAAQHLLTMCVRALDYVPPVDLTFGEYLRALITADHDLVEDDDLDYRVAVVSAFRDWGIYPSDVRSLSVDGLLWAPPESDAIQDVRGFFAAVPFDDWELGTDRRRSYAQMRAHGARLHAWLRGHVPPGQDRFLGLALEERAPGGLRRDGSGRPVFEVHSFRPCRRLGPDGQHRTDAVVEIVQRRLGFFDADLQQAVDSGQVPFETARSRRDFWFRGGSTLIIDPESGDLRYCVRKSITNEARLARERRFRQRQYGGRGGGSYFTDDAQASPFAYLHSGVR